jgi:hypothetical protein
MCQDVAQIRRGDTCRRRRTGEVVVVKYAQVEHGRTTAWLCNDSNDYPVIILVEDLEPLPDNGR